jgi:hypothetical protein
MSKSKRLIQALAVLSVIALAPRASLAGEETKKKPEHPEHPAKKEAPAVCAGCEKAKTAESSWCDHCGVGYIKGKKEACKECFTAKTTAAKVTKVVGDNNEKSGTVTINVSANRWCKTCKAGYVGAEKVSCEGCYKQKTGGTACATHGKKEENKETGGWQKK